MFEHRFSNHETEQINANNNLTLLIVGDIMLGEDFIRFKQEHAVSYEYPFEKTKEIFKSADIAFGNLECTLSKSGTLREKGPNLYSPPESINALKYLNFSIVSLGNNHINDFGEGGIIETTKILKDNNILFFGAGRDLNGASKEAIIERNGLKISFLGYTTDEEHVKSIIAGPNTAGCVFYDFEKIKEDIEGVRNKSDIICISLHWGYEHYTYPSPEQIELAHKIIDAGAQIIIGHHPHVIQGFERYNKGLIFYSLGNFFFPNVYDKSGFLHKWSKENNKSIIAKCNINNKMKVGKVEIVPVFMSEDYHVMVSDGRDKEKEVFWIEEISKEIKSRDYKCFWDDYRKKKEQELTEIEVIRLLKRMKELGVKGCIRKISIRNIKGTGKMLVKYILIKY